MTEPVAKVRLAAEALETGDRRFRQRPIVPAIFAEVLGNVATIGDRFDLDIAPFDRRDDTIVAADMTDKQLDLGIALRAAALGTTDRYIASSLWFQWYCYRMAAPLLGCWMLYRCVPDVSARNIAFRFDGMGRPVWASLIHKRVAVAAGESFEDGEVRQACGLEEEIGRILLDGHLLPLSERIRTRYGRSPTLLRGTIVAQIGLALAAIDAGSSVRWEAVATAMIDLLARMTPMSKGHGRLGDVIHCESCGREGVTFRRKTCCFIHRTGDGSKCDSCPRRTDEERARIYAQRLAERHEKTFV